MSSTSSYIEENTKAEEKMDRPMWDKNFPKILPPPEHVPEKENKEVDVELDMLVIPGGSVLDEPKPRAKKATPRMDVLDPNELIFDDRTQGSHEPLNKSKEKLAMAVKRSAERIRTAVNPLRSRSAPRKTPKKEGKSGQSGKSKSIKSEASHSISTEGGKDKKRIVNSEPYL